MKKTDRLLFVLLIGGMLSLFGDDGFYERGIRLEGMLTFKDIIEKAEDQLVVDIELPYPADNQAQKQYKHTISLEMLLRAIQANYAERNVPVKWRRKGDTVEVYEVDPLGEPVQKVASPRGPEMNSTQNRGENYPVRPSWAQKQNGETGGTDWSSVPELGSAGESSSERPAISRMEQTSLYEVRREAAQSRAQVPQPQAPDPQADYGGTKVVGVNNYQTRASEQQSVSVPSGGQSFTPVQGGYSPSQRAAVPAGNPSANTGLKITPYPEHATAFINDAPSITVDSGIESFVEWEVRMKGAVVQGNKKLLLREREQMKKRVEWLNQQLREMQ